MLQSLVMDPNIFEAIMMICFGAAWPFSIYKLLKTKKAKGKSIPFLAIVLLGYICGILFHLFGDLNLVIIFYIFNTCLVMIDLMLTIKYSKNTDQMIDAVVVE